MAERIATEPARQTPSIPLARGSGVRPAPGPPGAARAAVVALAFPAHGFNKVKTGDKMPAFTLKDTAGADAGFAPGQAHVMVFFKEGPNTANAFKRVGKSWAAMKDKGVVYLGVYFGKGKPEDAKALAERRAASRS